jgi:hypothetical protein
VSFLGVLALLFRWQRTPRESTLPAERLFGAMRAGLRYARHSKMLQALLMRAAAFYLPVPRGRYSKQIRHWSLILMLYCPSDFPHSAASRLPENALTRFPSAKSRVRLSR